MPNPPFIEALFKSPNVIPSLVACKISPPEGLYSESIAISFVVVWYSPFDSPPLWIPSNDELKFDWAGCELFVAVYSPNCAPSPCCKRISLFLYVSILV